MNAEINAGMQRQWETRKLLLTGVGILLPIFLFCLYRYNLITWSGLILWGSGLGLIIVTILLISDYQIFKLRLEEKLLTLQQEHLRSFSEVERQLEVANRHLGVCRDRFRALNDLHESITQGIHGIIYTAHTLRTYLAREEVEEDALTILTRLETTSSQVIYELKAMALELNPVLLEEKGLTWILELHCDLFARRHNMQIEQEITVDRHLPADLEMALYRITQEAFTNIQKHSGATQVLLSLTVRNNYLRLIIQDNGRGFDPATVEHGSGLENIATLVWENNGTFRLYSHPGQGTSIDVELQCP